MEQIIVKAFWDFRGPAAKRTAEHFEIHLKEFAEREGFSIESGLIEHNEFLFSIYWKMPKGVALQIKNTLKPNRFERVS